MKMRYVKMTEGKTFAETKWEQVQMDCAKAWANLDIAVEMIEENKAELTEDDYKAIKAQIDVQQEMIQNTLLEAKAEYLAAVNA
jgi:NACalpha-BTF3-like transcription factor